MNTNRVRELLRKKCDAIGGQRAWAREHGVSIAYVSYVLNGKIEPGWKILDPLGLERRRIAGALMDRLKVRTLSRSAKVVELSGGNQQKVVVAKWILTDPKVLIMNDPTRGVDVGAKVEIYKIMEELCRRGISIIMVTAELLEVIGITDRLLVFANGKIAGEFARKDYDQKAILHMAVKGNENGK